jgi:hypothetical protein
MRNDDIIGLVIALVVVVIFLTVYIGLIVLGVSLAKRKNRSPLDVVCRSPPRAANHADSDGQLVALEALPTVRADDANARAPVPVLRIQLCDGWSPGCIRAAAARLHSSTAILNRREFQFRLSICNPTGLAPAPLIPSSTRTTSA